MSDFSERVQEFKGKVKKYIEEKDIEEVADCLQKNSKIGELWIKYGECIGEEGEYEECMERRKECMEVYEESVTYLSGVLEKVGEGDRSLLKEVVSAIESYYRPVNILLLNESRYEKSYVTILAEIAKGEEGVKNGYVVDLSWVKVMCLPITSSCCMRCGKKIWWKRR